MQQAAFLEFLDDIPDVPDYKIRKTFGGKALGLIEANKLGISIPETWLVSADYFDRFTDRHPSLDSTNFKDKAKEFISCQINPEIKKLPDCPYAVRSSSQYEDSIEHSFAGIFESILDVPKHDLAEAIAEVWHSCHSFRAISYLKGTTSLRMGVIIQPMVEAKFAGVCFSRHPSPSNVFENHNIVIEFAPAAGDKIVQGQITPLRFSGSAEAISSATDAIWVDSLLKTMIELKNFHNYEIDIEFVVDSEENLIIVQQRPVSRLHASHVLDLFHYEKKYKRKLSSLDIELLIDGCARFLSSYLEVSYQLERWMVMVTNPDGKQELWTHKLLDEAVIARLSERFSEEHDFLETMLERYQNNVKTILTTDYTKFLDKNISLEESFFAWCEFQTPLTAHYYVPMFMSDALYLSLLRKGEKIDEKNAEDDLFFLGTYGISTLSEILQEKLYELKTEISPIQNFSELPPAALETLSVLCKQFGFLRCHQVYEEPYSEEELFELMKESFPKEFSQEEQDKWQLLYEKYCTTPNAHLFLAHFREWMRIRNQDMEYFLFAVASSRPLFEEIGDHLDLSVKALWNSSKEMILKAIHNNDPQFVQNFPHENLIIYHSYGKTRLTDKVHFTGLEAAFGNELRGKKVYGEGKMEAIVKIAFSPEELEKIGKMEKNVVLVTGMTTPDFIPYLKKNFIALITDEGGILCHAAIVAREIHIPCIVGAGMATEILKDGMKVVIDFDLGRIAC